jgi:hypothetical protein
MQTNRWSAAAFMVVATAGQAQNLVLNSDFDDDISGWAPTGTPTWNSMIGSPLPGSAELYSNDGYVKLTQCVPISNLASSMSLTANVYMFPDTTSGFYVFQTYAYADPGCTDAVFYNDGLDIVGQPVVAGAWSGLSNTFVAVPAGYQSLSLALETAGGSGVGHFAFDHIVLMQVTDRVFGTGFELNEGYQ